ncbi:aminotransferase class I/II-fold pyridoxal phosphate-dependent enzyme [bacterium]|nr:aminotransferase class I/II-fold pyridoxal phosphate-dependent enzyme [bacterium]
MSNYRIETIAIHEGESRVDGAVVFPIFQTANFESPLDSHDLRYIRYYNTPNQELLHKKLAALENGEAGLVTSSGMAAISTLLLTFLPAGSHILAQDKLFAGTHTFFSKDFPKLGLAYSLVDGTKPETWKSHLKNNTRIFYAESIGNPLLDVPDLEAIVSFSKEHGLITVIDNTFASPVNFKPIDIGFDFVVHSCTKYLNGHSDIVSGVVVGKASAVEQVRDRALHLGGCLDPHAAFLLNRGLKTVVLRVLWQNANALKLAHFLSSQPAVKGVYYPGLESHTGHERAKRLFKGYGGMLSFELKNEAHLNDFLTQLQIPILAGSLGAVETLITLPARTTHSRMSREDRLRAGISDSLIRVSVGIENPDDLVEDFQGAFRKIH